MGRAYAAPSTHIGRLIEQGLRQSNLLDRSELAARCGVHRSYISKLTKGEVQSPRDDILLSLAATLNQDVDDYRMALLADSGRLPQWEKLLANEVAIHEGVRLSSEDEASIRRYVLALVKQRRGKS